MDGMNEVAGYGPAARSSAELSEASHFARFPGELPSDVGPCDNICRDCEALHWRAERTQRDMKATHATFSMCCQKKAVALLSDGLDNDLTPSFLRKLLTGRDQSKWTTISPWQRGQLDLPHIWTIGSSDWLSATSQWGKEEIWPNLHQRRPIGS
ncbi:uncharacterized protein MELLADRAFT_110987 [Melampsora larici-populina 98AG31]|uniref:Uncharacterized protein n=1 Tax=Melampsora larici-populina (strain 98AG31 / pathotype 3-4-7) TaxID=747676 RepID=F4S1N5_MELLP|nr:uncharacterized protein MELLADRAFT_110987 [Melampsora larici-populina 98AG31]EGG01410.1 hypothetical protein MELLADRAFT_110987 [Melampsora larici-populina 98AG31]